MKSLGLMFLVVALCWADAGDVVSVISAPAGNPDGLVWINNYLYVTSDDTHDIYQVNPASGAVISSFAGPGSADALTGLTFDGTYLWSCSPPSIYKLSLPGGGIVSTIASPSPSASEGLVWISGHLWNCSSSNDAIYELDPATGSVISYFVPSGADGTLGLTYDGTYMWASFIGSMLIYRLIPGDPVPVQFFLAPTESPQDLAWDGQYLWLAEYETSAHLYQIDPGVVGLDSRSWAGIKSNF